jgi:CubicO group peptidase (beta-lactamase class C family)
MKRFPISLVLVLAFCATNLATGSHLAAQDQPTKVQHCPNKDLQSSLERIVTSVVDPDGPGAAVLVVKDGKVLLKKGFGLADLDKNTPVTPQTTFELASGSKPITALAILMLELAGKLDLDDDIRKYIPELPVYDDKRPIRLTHLLNHTSGLPDHLNAATHSGTTADMVKLTAGRKLNFVTGSRFQYSNMNFRLLGLVVERVSGKTLGTFLHDEVFAPLGMTRTVVRESARIVPANQARGYSVGGLLDGGKKYRIMENDFVLVGEAGVWSCLDDMLKLDAAIASGKLLKAETWQRAWTRGKLNDGSEIGYGLGWFVEKGNGKQGAKISHSGGWPGFTSHHLRLPEQKITVIVLRNFFHLQGGSPIEIANRLATVALEGPPSPLPLSPRVGERGRGEGAVMEAPSAARRQKFVGVYQLENAKEFTATVVDGKDGLTVRFPGEAPYALVPAGPKRFALLGLGDGFFVTFAKDKDHVRTLTVERPQGLKNSVFRSGRPAANVLKEFDRHTAEQVANQVWIGDLTLTPDGKEVVRLAFRFTVKDDALTGVLDSPDGGVVGVELSQIRLTKEGIAFTLGGARFEGTLSADGTEIVGHWNEGGAKVLLRFRPAR